MPRDLVERTFPDGLAIPMNDEGAQVCLAVVGNNAVEGVTWLHSYVTDDKGKTFCIYDAPSPETIRRLQNSTVCRLTASRKHGCWIRISINSRSIP